jgi:hypothetical protein
MATRTNPFSRHLEVYEDSWKTEHEQVKKGIWKFEDKLAVGVALFKAIHDRYWTWRDRVARGAEAYDPEDEQEIKECFASWLRPCEHVAARLEQLEDQYGSVEGGREFRRYCLEAKRILETWGVPAAWSVRVSAHTCRTFDAGQLAEELDEVSRAAPESIPLKHKPDYSQVF